MYIHIIDILSEKQWEKCEYKFIVFTIVIVTMLCTVHQQTIVLNLNPSSREVMRGGGVLAGTLIGNKLFSH
jgi:hypothetical protein